MLLYSMAIYVIVGFLIAMIFRRYHWIKPGYEYATYLTEKSLEKFILSDNIHYERFGTGRILSTFERGITIWYTYLTNLVVFTVKFSIIVCFVIWRMYGIGEIYVVILLVAIVLMVLWITWNNHKSLIWKTTLKEKETEHTRKLVKIFMSKFEVLQNKQYKNEIQSLKT